jgi:hypothetical protein
MKFDENEAKIQLEKGYEDAEKLLNDKDNLERFLQRLEEKLKIVPIVGERLSQLPALVSLLKAYVSGEYKDVPIGTIIAIISALP